MVDRRHARSETFQTEGGDEHREEHTDAIDAEALAGPGNAAEHHAAPVGTDESKGGDGARGSFRRLRDGGSRDAHVGAE